jgi:GAF domain-containing protein
VDSLTQEEIRVGTLIVDSGKEGVPISGEDFEYLKVIGELIGAAVGKAELSEQLILPTNSTIGQGSGFGTGCRDTLSGNTIAGVPFGAI